VLNTSCDVLHCVLQVLSAKVKLMALQEALLQLEMDCVEVVAGLVTEFDRSYSEMAEANKLQYNSYFTQVGSFLPLATLLRGPQKTAASVTAWRTACLHTTRGLR
jgi:hypothetical protein